MSLQKYSSCSLLSPQIIQSMSKKTIPLSRIMLSFVVCLAPWVLDIINSVHLYFKRDERQLVI